MKHLLHRIKSAWRVLKGEDLVIIFNDACEADGKWHTVVANFKRERTVIDNLSIWSKKLSKKTINKIKKFGD